MTISPPPPAAAAGFNTLVFNDDFTSGETLTNSMTPQSGYQWYPWLSGQTSPTNYQVLTTATAASTSNGNSGGGSEASPDGGILQLNGDANLNINDQFQTVPLNYSGSSEGTYKHAYFDAYIQFNDTQSSSHGWPAFWLWGLPGTGGNPVEVDVVETGFNNEAPSGGSDNVEWTVHDPGGATSVASGSMIHPVDSNWHDYGVLWTGNGTTGTLTFYLDNQQVGGPVPVGSGTNVPDMENSKGLYMILGTGPGITENVDWVHVWQGGGAPAPTPSPPPPSPPSPVVAGSGSDALVLNISEDAYANGDGTSDAAGDALFTVSVDGVQIGSTFTALASHAAGQDQTFTLNGDWAPGTHTVTVNFLNDAYAGTSSTDRNLYVDGVTYDGTNTGQSAALMSSGPRNFGVSDTTAIPSPPTPTPSTSTLAVAISEDAYKGDAQFTVSVDGQQVGGAQTAHVLHSTGADEVYLLTGDWGTGQHDVKISFLNDAYAGTPSTDRNLYVNSIALNGTTYSGTSAALMSTGSRDFAVGGTVPTASAAPNTLTLHLSEDAWNGNAQFRVSIDGKTLDTAEMVTALHASGGGEDFTYTGNFGAGAHNVGVTFLNDAYGGTSSTDRNLYVNSVTFDSHSYAGATLMSNGTAHFSVSA